MSTNKQKKVENYIKLFIIYTLKTLSKKMNFQNKIKKNQKTWFFDFLSKDRFLDLDKNNFLWPGNEDQLLAVIKALPFFDSSEKVVGFISFCNNDFIFADQETLRFFENLKKINYNKLTVSVLFSYLKIKYKKNNGSLEYPEWSYVVSILLNPEISDIVLDFLLEMDIPVFLEITKTESEFMKAVCLHFLFINSPVTYSSDLREFYNLLRFLKVEESLINSLDRTNKETKKF